MAGPCEKTIMFQDLPGPLRGGRPVVSPTAGGQFRVAIPQAGHLKYSVVGEGPCGRLSEGVCNPHGERFPTVPEGLVNLKNTRGSAFAQSPLSRSCHSEGSRCPSPGLILRVAGPYCRTLFSAMPRATQGATRGRKLAYSSRTET